MESVFTSSGSRWLVGPRSDFNMLYQQRSMIYRMTQEYVSQKVMTVALIAVVDFYERLVGL